MGCLLGQCSDANSIWATDNIVQSIIEEFNVYILKTWEEKTCRFRVGMHGYSSGLAFLANAEVDSMGGVLDGGVGIGTKASPCRAAIEKAQSELRQEYDVRDERRKELEFLEKGGNPLDFKLGQTASVSVQSTSHTDQHPEQIGNIAAKGSFPLNASPLGDSVESNRKIRSPTTFEPNSADNLLLFDGENELHGGRRISTRHNRRNAIVTSKQSSQMDGSQNAKESEDSAIFRPYKRRNRSKSNREGARSVSTDIVPSCGGHVSSLPTIHSSRDTKGSILETNSQKDQNKSSNSSQKSASIDGDTDVMVVGSDNQFDKVFTNPHKIPADLKKSGVPEGSIDVTGSNDMHENAHIKHFKVGTLQTIVGLAPTIRPDIVSGKDEVISTNVECSTSCVAKTKNENEDSPGQLNGFSSLKSNRDGIQSEVQISCATLNIKNLDSKSSCTQTNLTLEGSNESDIGTNVGNVDDKGILKEQMLALKGTENIVDGATVKENDEAKPLNSVLITHDGYDSVHQNHSKDSSIVKVEEMHIIEEDLQNVVISPTKIEGMETNNCLVTETNEKTSMSSERDMEFSSITIPQGTMGYSFCEQLEATPSGRDSADAPGIQTYDHRFKVANKAYEDAILEEARVIEAKQKRISELFVSPPWLLSNHRKTHWDLVLEEMEWLANDFAQERLWKTTVASQISKRVASSSRSRFKEQNLCRKQKKVALTVVKAVMHYWCSVEELVNSINPRVSCKKNGFDLCDQDRDYGNEVTEQNSGECNMETNKELKLQCGEDITPLKRYGVRFMKYNRTIVPCIQAEAPVTPDRISDLGIQESSIDDYFKEERLFYLVPYGALEMYRNSIASCVIHYKENVSYMMQDEVDTSIYDDAEDFSQENTYEEEGESSMQYYSGNFEQSIPSNLSHNKRKNFIKAYTGRSYEPRADATYGNDISGTHQSILIRKRPADNLHAGSIPTKRVRTASRQRVQSPFSSGGAGTVQAVNKTDASSGDTNSFQDDLSSLHSGSHLQKSSEVESVVDFVRPSLFDSGEISAKHKKKKKAKHLKSTYDQRWQLDSFVHNEQRENSKKRLQNHRFESNKGNGLFGHHKPKKPRMMNQYLDNTLENISPMNGSIPLSVASQMSNMINTNKFMKLIGGQGRGKKTKSSKMTVGQPGSGSPWSLFEDQALVVLVHDMGPNWELVSDAINTTLQFKCIFRIPKECKDRHKNLMDRTAGDGADSAEDSGSSQPYPSTLPGIPKGSARQLFQHLQGPMEEDTLKSHFEKIISIGQSLHFQRSQSDNQEMNHVAQVHNSHVLALSEVCPNNLNGDFLTPLDLCDLSASIPDVISNGYQGPHSNGLSITNQGCVSPIIPASGAYSSLQGSSSMVLGSSMASLPGPVNPSIRDGRYGIPRTSLPIDEQQRLQQYNAMISGRNIQQSNSPVSGAIPGNDRAARMLPGGNGTGVISGMNRSMQMSRPGFHGSILNSGNMLSSAMVGLPSPGTMNPGASSGQGNSMSRPREGLHMMRPGQNLEHQRQMMLPELQMQVTNGNNQGVLPLNSPGSNFSNQTAPGVPTYPIHSSLQYQMPTQSPQVLQTSQHPHLQGPTHISGTRNPSYAQVKERHLLHQQRMMQQQHHFSASNTLMQHVQPQPQLLVSSSSIQNNTQNQQTSQPSTPSSTPSSVVAPLVQSPQNSPSGVNNQMVKQRQRQQQFQPSGRLHHQSGPQIQAQQQAKFVKGMGRGNMLLHQSLPVPPHLNGISMTPGNQIPEKGEQVMHLKQGQGLYSGSGPSRSIVPIQSANQSQLQQKLLSAPSPPLPKQPPHMPSNSGQGHAPLVHSSSQDGVPSVMTPNYHHQQLHLQPHQKQVNQTQPRFAQRVVQQNNNHEKSDLLSDSIPEQSHADQRPPEELQPPQVYGKSNNITPVMSSLSAPQWKPSEGPEPVSDSGMQNPESRQQPVPQQKQYLQSGQDNLYIRPTGS